MDVSPISPVLPIYIETTDASLTPRVAHSAVDEVFANYQPAAAALAAPCTEPQPSTVEFTVKKAAVNLDRAMKKPRVGKQLDDIVEKIKDMKVDKIEVIAYALFFRELATPRAQAVKDYLVAKGIDASLISVHGKGVGYREEAVPLARNLGFTIKITGTDKADAAAQVAGNPASRPAPNLIA